MQHQPTKGYCQCGCGERTKLATQNHSARGYVKGEPYAFVAGHQCRKSAAEYVVEDRGHDTPCWIWQRAVGKSTGYGMGRDASGLRTSAHRVIYERTLGQIPEGMQLDHLCRVRACVNPFHMEPVTNAENVRRGAKAKLTREQVEAIKVSTLSHTEVAREYGVHPTTIHNVRSGKRWAA